jgi:hypothetical protein
MSLKFRVAAEIKGGSPDTLRMMFEFSDEQESDVEFYSNLDLPEDVSDRLGALAVDFINSVGELVLRKTH